MQKVALIGAGFMARTHGAAYGAIPNARLVAVVDTCSDAAEKLSSSLGVPAFADFDEMLKAVSPDVVDICTPTCTHLEYVSKSADAGKHILLEKPMARTLEDCQRIIDWADRAGVTLMVAQVLRFYPEYAAAKHLVESGAVGNPAAVRIARGGGHPGGWYADLELGGGILIDFMVHDFDWLLWTFGEAERVYAKILKTRGIDDIDYALVTVRFKNGLIAHINGNWAYPMKGFTSEFEIAGDAGLLKFDNQAASSIALHTGKCRDCAGVTSYESPPPDDPYFLEIKHFIDCIETGTKPMVLPEESMNAVRLGLAALESALSGKPVEVGSLTR